MTNQLEPDQIDEDLVPTPAARVHAVEIDGEAVLLDQGANTMHRLNPTATIVWASFDGRSSIRDIGADLAEELGLPVEQLTADVLALTRELAGLGLLEPSDCTPGDDALEPAASAAVAIGDPRFVTQLPSP